VFHNLVWRGWAR